MRKTKKEKEKSLFLFGRQEGSEIKQRTFKTFEQLDRALVDAYAAAFFDDEPIEIVVLVERKKKI